MTRIDVIDHPADALGECPVWSPTEGALYWEDIDGSAIHRLDPSSGLIDTRSLPGRPGAFSFTGTPGRLVFGMEHQVVFMDWATGSIEPFVDLEPADNGNRLNDGKCDPAGRFVIGSMTEDRSTGAANGVLHCVEADGSHVALRHGISVSNALAFDDDRGRMYWADSGTGRILVWDYDIDTGDRRNGRVFFDFEDLPGKPDGGCLDAEGCYWSAEVHGAALTRITPEGVLDRRIDLPLAMPTMPAFAGPDSSTVYVTSIGDHGPDQRRIDAEPGSLLVLDDVGVTGRPEPVFAGGGTPSS